jgi:hypothetical protein
VAYPVEFVGKPWRLLYTLPGGVPREVHWSPPAGDLLAHIVEPAFGRADRDLDIPINSGYEITPVGSPPQHALTRVFTTGVWTVGEFIGTSSGETFNYNFFEKAQSLSGPRGRPESVKSDYAILADYRTSNGCRVTSGVAAFAVPDLVADTYQPPAAQPMYYSADKQVDLNLGGPAPVELRLQDVLGARFGATTFARMEYGYAPSIAVFGFSKPVPDQILDFALPGPQLISLINCTLTPSVSMFQTPSFADPPDLRGRFPQLVHIEVANQRVAGLATLTSGFSAVVTSGSYTFASDFAVAAPTVAKLRRSTNEIDIAGGPDGQLIPTGTGLLELILDVEPTAGLVADYFDITLYEIVGSNLRLQRVYTVTDRKLMLDPAFLVTSSEYVFEIRSYSGRPEIARANFSVNTYPQYSATIFTSTFKTPP